MEDSHGDQDLGVGPDGSEGAAGAGGLEELLGGLGGSPGKPVDPDDLDAMLGDLLAQLDRAGVDPSGART